MEASLEMKQKCLIDNNNVVMLDYREDSNV